MTATTTAPNTATAAALLAVGIPRDGSVDRNDAIRIIRAELKRRSGKTWSVTGGKGTAWGWITITAPPARRVAHLYDAATETTTEIPADASHGAWYMSEADCAELADLLSLSKPVHCQGESIAASSEHRREYIARALGVEPLSFGTPYWD